MPLLQTILFAAAPLIALTNPLAEIPIFLTIVDGRTPREVRRAAYQVAVGVWAVLTFSAVGGLQLLAVLGIELSAFRAAGGLLLVIMGLEMLRGRDPSWQSDRRRTEDPEDALWVPLVMPMLAGPGAIVITVSLTVREVLFIWWIPVATVIAVTLSALIVYTSLALAGWIGARIGARGTRILTRFSGLILVAIGFQMGFTGIGEFFSI